MDEQLYLVTAYRFGRMENVFPIGIFSSYEEALTAATNHRHRRGGKYEHRITPWTLGVWSDHLKANNEPTLEARR